MSLLTDSCEFCHKISGLLERAWYDFHIVAETESYVAVAALGSLLPGYILVVSRCHVASMANLNSCLRDELYRFCFSLKARLRDVWGESSVFEHGSCSKERTAGSCIVHAHWHIVPSCPNLIENLEGFDEASSFEAVAESDRKGEGYLFFETPGGLCHVRYGGTPQSQYFRRVLADLIGRTGEWDYLAYPFLGNLKRTVEFFVDHGNIRECQVDATRSNQ